MNHRTPFRAPRSLALAFIGLALLIGGCSKDDLEIEDGREASELYDSAKRYLNNNNWNSAILGYKQLTTRFPFGRYTEQAQLELAYAHYRANESESAIATLDRFIRTYPTHPNVDYAYYLKGLVRYDQGVGFLESYLPERVRDRDQTSVREAYNNFDELVRRYPDSRYAPEARQRMQFLRNSLAHYETTVAEYYLRRKAYVAAVNRARFALETYPGSPASAEALHVMSKAYDALEMPELASDARRVLELNYPGYGADSDGWFSNLWPFGSDE